MFASPMAGPWSALTQSGGKIWDEDSEALFACAEHGGSLCTVIGIDGAWSRRLGAQLAVLPDGSTRGSLADACLDRALAKEVERDPSVRVWRIGKGSSRIDFRLPCGSGIDLLIEPHVDITAARTCAVELAARRSTRRVVRLDPASAVERFYMPSPRLIVLGTGPEVAALARLCDASGIECTIGSPVGDPCGDGTLSLGRTPDYQVDGCTAIVALFHDHEWERDILPWALGSDAFYVGAQGGRRSRENRVSMLRQQGCDDPSVARLISPVGCVPGARTPLALGLSILTDVMFTFDARRPQLRITER